MGKSRTTAAFNKSTYHNIWTATELPGPWLEVASSSWEDSFVGSRSSKFCPVATAVNLLALAHCWASGDATLQQEGLEKLLLRSNFLKSIAFNTLEGCVKPFSLVLSIQLPLHSLHLSVLLLRGPLNDNPRILFGLPPSSLPILFWSDFPHRQA